MTAPQHVPAGSSVQLGQPSFPPDAGFVDRLRRVVAADPAVAAAYVISIAVQEPGSDTFAPATDLVGLDLVDASTPPEPVIERIGDAIAEAVPADVELSVAVLSESARATALRAVAPVGAGGEVEVLAAACGRDPSLVPRFVDALLARTVFLPAVGEPVEDPSEPRAPRIIEPGDQVEYPVITVDGHDTIAVFSSWWTLLHADPPYAEQLEVPASQLLANWPDGVALALDLGTQHSLQIPATDAERLRGVVRAG